MKDDIHNMVLVDSSADRAVLVSLGDVEKALQNVKGTKVQSLFIAIWLQSFQEKCSSTEMMSSEWYLYLKFCFQYKSVFWTQTGETTEPLFYFKVIY